MADVKQREPNEHLRRARRQRRWTQQRLATEIGVSVTSVSRWESGVQRPDLHDIERLTAVLGRTAEELGLGEEESKGSRARRGPDVQRLVPEIDTMSVPREMEDEVIARLEAASVGPVASRVVSIHGPSGFGKTTLARRICHDRRVQAAFPDGTAWVGTGPECTSAKIVQVIGDLCVQFGAERPALTDADQAGYFLAQVLGNRKFLLVIDNVWAARDLGPFLAGGPNCVRLVTTQNATVCPPDSIAAPIGPMSFREMEHLLILAMPSLDTGALPRLCGGWPLLAQIVSAAIRRDVEAGASPGRAVMRAEEELRALGPHAFDVWDADQRVNAIGKAIHLGLDRLEVHVSIGPHRNLRDRYLSLAVFPPSEPVPLRLLSSWWGSTAGWTHPEVRRFCHELVDRSLVTSYDADAETISLHDMFRAYLRSEISDRLEALNRSLLQTWSDGRQPWVEVCRKNPELLAYLAYHLFEGGLHDELLALLGNPAYISAKAERLGALPLQDDARFASLMAERKAPGVAVVEKILRRSFLLTGMRRSGDIASTLNCLARREGIDDDLWRQLIEEVADRSQLKAAWWLKLDEPGGAPPTRSRGHVGAVTSVVIDYIGDEEVIVSGGEDGTVRVWSWHERAQVMTLIGHTGWVDTVALAGNRRLIASGGEDRSIRLWDAVDGSFMGMLMGHDARVRCLAFVEGGRVLMSGAEDGRVCAWDTLQQRMLAAFTGDRRIWTVAINSSDGTVFIGGDGPSLRRVSLVQEQAGAGSSRPGELMEEVIGHSDWIRSVAAARAIRKLASGSGDTTVALWHTEGKLRRQAVLKASSRVRSVAFSDDDSRIAAGCEDGCVRVWSTEDGRNIATLRSGADWVRSACFTPGGDVLGACEDGVIRRWDTSTCELMASLGKGRPVAWSLAWVEPANMVALGTAAGRIDLRDTSSRKLQSSLDAGSGRVWSLAAARARFCVAAACGDGAVRIWTQLDDEPITIDQHRERAWAVALDPAGVSLAIGFGSGRVEVWDIRSATLRTEHQEHIARVRTLAFDSTGDMLASGSGDGTIRLWRVAHPASLQILDNHGEWVRAVAMAQHGGYVAGGSGRGTIRVWDASNGDVVADLMGHAGRVLSLGFSTDGRRLLSGAADGTVRLWDIEREEELCRIRIEATLLACASNSKASSMLAASAEDIVAVSMEG